MARDVTGERHPSGVAGHPGGGRSLLAASAERVVAGTFVIEIPTPRTLSILAGAGFDFVVVDLEHSPLGIGGLEAMVAGAAAVGLPMLVRVWAADPGIIGKILDIGATGVMVPHVTNSEEARRVVAAARYPPRGDRSVVPLTSYVQGGQTTLERDHDCVVVLQLEGPEAIERCAEIAGVEGVDGIFVGVFDLAASLGADVAIDGPEVERAALSVVARVGDRAVLGIYVHHPAQSAAWGAHGFPLQCVSFDGAMLDSGARAALSVGGATAREPAGDGAGPAPPVPSDGRGSERSRPSEGGRPWL